MAAYRRRSTSAPPFLPLIGLAVLLVIVGVGAWFWLRSGSEASDDWSPSALPSNGAPALTELPDGSEPPPLDLPVLTASDAFVRRMVSTLSSHPQLAAWLITDDLIQRFVGTVVDLAGGFHPAEHVPMLQPDAPFEVEDRSGTTVIAESSFRRYDLHAAVAQSLDTEGTVRLFRQLRPLIDEAWAERGLPGTFDDALELALGNLLAVDIPDGPLAVTRVEGVYVFEDAELEARRGAAKALLRMGPDNARRVQEKLRDVQVRLPRASPGG